MKKSNWSNLEIFKEALRVSGKRALCDNFSRYIFILNNHYKGQTLSKIEPLTKNYRPAYAKELLEVANGFNIPIDIKSKLFEDRLDFKRGNFLPEKCVPPNSYNYFIQRFFKRIELFRLHSIKFDFDDLLCGNIIFVDNFGDKFLDEDQLCIDVSVSDNYRIINYRKEIHYNIVKFLKNKLDLEKDQTFKIQEKFKYFIGCYIKYQDDQKFTDLLKPIIESIILKYPNWESSQYYHHFNRKNNFINHLKT